MFKCQICGQSSPAKTSPHTIIVRVRSKIYPERFKIIAPKGHEKKEKKIRIDKGGWGWEIAQELKVCGLCAEKRRI